MYKHNLSVDESAIIWYSTENMEQQFCLENLPQLLKNSNHQLPLFAITIKLQ